jgi:hypothetical protein
MKNFDVVSRLPGIVAAALSNDSGTLLQCTGNIDGESAGAIAAFSVQSLGKAGEELGLGSLQRIVVADPARSCVALVLGEEVLSVYADPGKPFATIEKKLEDLFNR